ncbi:uncharacterized protein SPPG_00284 [Spizellomyces punctatus DAOM BR117]|uniref:Uncharacterized protein n=1 Tax=Spizellomyces punctatus (strain DAOM BR117) TaxID=645134 RepID=A0A0L0HU01_SPIPD|nr:uncharacterized protein SPPG_00284 [Spizellomyces punctatus DAOM BR117]KND04563.1 hypothetical protein SPPG_00284 [Spizellomyces punctatus DAOM BR117]|eukprot:XP_016612602.1 hypothetical protein SPPG_00284 [Spizellomyces punctatus DAOM BR117]
MSYACDSCSMGVTNLHCGKCGKGLVMDTIVDGGETIAVSRCPGGCGMIKSPTCCGKDMKKTSEKVSGTEAATSKINYSCGKCGMSVKDMQCNKCGKGLQGDTVDVEGSKVGVSKCPQGCGMIKSPMCCGMDMVTVKA